MKSFDYKGKQVFFSEAVGIVAGAHKHAETAVSGSGGGGSTYNGQGHTQSVSITSTVTVKQDFFLKTANGKQVPVQLSGVDIPIMDGQVVTMISGSAGRKKRWTHLVNHDTESCWPLGDVMDLIVAAGMAIPPWISVVIGLAIWIAVGVMLGGWIGFVAAVGFWIFDLIRRIKAGNLHGAFAQNLVQEALKTRPSLPMA